MYLFIEEETLWVTYTVYGEVQRNLFSVFGPSSSEEQRADAVQHQVHPGLHTVKGTDWIYLFIYFNDLLYSSNKQKERRFI